MIKRDWVNVMNNHPKISDDLALRIKYHYEHVIDDNLKKAYRQKIVHLEQRADFDGFLRKVQVNEKLDPIYNKNSGVATQIYKKKSRHSL